MATLVKVSRKREKKIRAVRGTVGLLDYDDLTRKDEILGRYIIIPSNPNFNVLFYNTNKLRYQSKNNFSSFSSFFLMKIILFSFINITRSRCAKIELTKRKSDPVIIKIQMLHFLYSTWTTTNCFLTNTYRTSIDSFRMVISLKFHYQGANGYFVRHDLISSYSPYPSWSETVYWNNQAKQIAFFGWNWSWIARLSPISR